MRVNVTIRDADVCLSLAQIAVQEGMTVDEWLNHVLVDVKWLLEGAARDQKRVGGVVRLKPDLRM